MSDSATRQAAREAAMIAAGLPRAEVEQRARQAFDSANDIRARLQGLPDIAKRAHAVSRARAWASILHHMDRTGEPQFCGCPHDSTPPAIARAAWATWDWLAWLASLLSPAAWARDLRDLLGTEPVTFYHQPGAPPAGDGQPARLPEHNLDILFTQSVLTGARPRAHAAAPRAAPPPAGQPHPQFKGNAKRQRQGRRKTAPIAGGRGSAPARRRAPIMGASRPPSRETALTGPVRQHQAPAATPAAAPRAAATRRAKRAG